MVREALPLLLLLLLSSATAVLGWPWHYTMGAGCHQPVAVSWDLACTRCAACMDRNRTEAF